MDKNSPFHLRALRQKAEYDRINTEHRAVLFEQAINPGGPQMPKYNADKSAVTITNQESLKKMAARSTAASAKLKEVHAEFKGRADAIEAKYATKLAELLPEVRARQKPVFDKAKLAELKELRAQEDYAAIPELESEIASIRQAAFNASPFLTSVLSQANLWNIGTEIKARYTAELAPLGYNSLKSMAAFALAKGDMDLAAALVNRVHAIAKKDRPFDVEEYAQQAFGNLIAEVPAALEEAEVNFKVAVAMRRDFEGFAVTPATQVEFGLAHRSAGRVLPNKRVEPIGFEDEGGTTSLDKINAGLAAGLGN